MCRSCNTGYGLCGADRQEEVNKSTARHRVTGQVKAQHFHTSDVVSITAGWRMVKSTAKKNRGEKEEHQREGENEEGLS